MLNARVPVPPWDLSFWIGVPFDNVTNQAEPWPPSSRAGMVDIDGSCVNLLVYFHAPNQLGDRHLLAGRC